MHTDADHLSIIGNQHQLVFLDHSKACHNTAITRACFDIGDALPAAAGAPVIRYRCAFPIAVFGYRQNELGRITGDDRHRYNRVLAQQPDTANTGAGPPAEHANSIDSKSDCLAVTGCQKHVVIFAAWPHTDQLIPIIELHGNFAVAHDIGEVAQPVAPDIARCGGEHDMQRIPAGLVIRHRHDRIDCLIQFNRQDIHHRLAKRLRCRLGQAIAFQLIDHTTRGEEQNRRMRVCNKQLRDEILITGFHAGPAFATTTLGTIDGQRYALDITAMADRHHHVFLLDQILIILINKLI